LPFSPVFLQQRDHLQQNGALLGDAMLFFGCRHLITDCHRNELEDYGRRGVAWCITTFRGTKVRTYVQDLITTGDQIWSD
jgi:cytochrome P450/NADPH-cytochrome P450 reductase